MIIAFFLAAAAPSLPPGTVVVGISTIDGTTTDVVAIAPSGEREVLTTLDHGRGRIPKGALFGELLVTTSRVDDNTATVVERTDLNTGARFLVDTGALALQAPQLVREVGATTPTLVTVRTALDGPLEIARNGASCARVEGGASWIEPATGDPDAFLVVDASGGTSIVEVDSVCFIHTRASLAPGRYRSASVLGRSVVVERDVDASHADLVDATSGATLHRGLPGMDPRALGDGRVVYGAGTKHGAISIARVDGAKLVDVITFDSGMPGAATPLAAEVVDHHATVVAWLNRGAAFPGALVKLTQTDRGTDAQLLAAPTPGAAYEVYGFVVTR